MFENYIVVSGVITLAWIGLIVAYMVISNRQKGLEEELDGLQKMLDGRAEKNKSGRALTNEEIDQ